MVSILSFNIEHLYPKTKTANRTRLERAVNQYKKENEGEPCLDAICLQETRLDEDLLDQAKALLPGYKLYHNKVRLQLQSNFFRKFICCSKTKLMIIPNKSYFYF